MSISQKSQAQSIPALEVENLTVEFGGLKAVTELSFKISPQVIFGMMGPNGAGKTTVFNLLTGLYRPTTGKIQAFGHSLLGYPPYQIAKKGVARTFQNIRLFKNLSVLSNVMIAMDNDPAGKRSGLFPSILRTSSSLAIEFEQEAKALALLAIFQLETKKDVIAKNLSYGDQRRLEIARAMGTGAKLLLLDEPAAGLNSNETMALMSTIRKIRDDFGMTVLLIEHDMKLVMGICEVIIVLDHGIKIAEGPPLSIQRDPQVIEAYLGEKKAGTASHA